MVGLWMARGLVVCVVPPRCCDCDIMRADRAMGSAGWKISRDVQDWEEVQRHRDPAG